MSTAITGFVRLLHILTAVTWVGGAFIWSMVIAPRILKNGPPQIRRPFAEAVIPAVTRFFMISAGLALTSGILLVGMIWGWPNYADAFQVPTYGPSLTLGALGGIGMAIVGFGIIAPTAHKMLAAMKSASTPPTPEQQAQLAGFGKKVGMMGMLVVLLGTVAIIGMTWAVNAVR